MEQLSPPPRAQDLVVPLLVLTGLGNALFFPLASADRGAAFLAVLWAGVLGAQVGLNAAWLVLWTANLWWRLAVGIATALFLFGALVLGTAAASLLNEFKFSFFMVNCLLFLPLMSLAAQAPFWLIRIGFRMRVERPHAEMKQCVERPLSIRDMLTATALIAIVISLARLARATPSDESTMIVRLLLAATAVTIVSAATTLPLTIAILGSRDPARGCTFALTVYGTLLALLVGIFSAIRGSTPPAEALAFPFGMIAAFLATQTGVLIAARHHGIHLVKTSHRDTNEPKASLPDSDA